MLDGTYQAPHLEEHNPQDVLNETIEVRAGLALKAIRQGRDVSVTRAAEMMGKNKRFVYSMESGTTKMRLDFIQTFIKPLGADFTDFAEQMGWL